MFLFLERIVENKRGLISKLKCEYPVSCLEATYRDIPPPRDFYGAITHRPLSVIAEIKRRSPSKGWIREDTNPLEVASIYEANGAAAISVLTEEEFFGGQSWYLPLVKEAVNLPILRKDFIIDPYQLYESRALGADAVLLIAALHGAEELRELVSTAHGLGLSSVVEVHTRGELDIAMAAGATVIGINNRDLRTFTTDLESTARLLPFIPRDRVVISESGIRNRADIERLHELGVRCFLVGEALMTAGDIGAKLRELLGKE